MAHSDSTKRSTPPTWLRILLPLALIIAWFVAAGVGGPYFGKIGEVSSNDQTTFLPQSSDATKAQQQINNFRDTSAVPALLVLTRDDTDLPVTDLQFAKDLPATLADVEGVKGDVSPAIPSQDGQAALIVVPVDSEGEYRDIVAALNEKIDASAPDGLQHYITGPVGFLSDLGQAFAGIDGLLLAVALAVVFVILLAVYRSPLLPFIVLATSLFALCASVLAVWWLAKFGVLQINGQVQGILFILVIGAATDYSLLYVARYKEELTRFQDKWQATAAAWKGSFEPIVASGATVTAGLLCLLLSDLASNKALGPVGALGIFLSVLAVLTLLPALLYFAGRASYWPLRPAYDAKARTRTAAVTTKKGVWAKLARVITGNTRTIWLGTLTLLVVFAVGAVTFKADGVPQSELVLGTSAARDGQQVLDDHFDGGAGSPAIIIGSATLQNELAAAIADQPGVASVAALSKESPSGTVPVGPDASVAAAFTNGAAPTIWNDKIALQATLADAPDSMAAETTVRELRQAVQDVDASAIVGGETASFIDTNDTAIRDRTLIIPVILGAITLILMLLLRSILAPLLLILTTAISFGTALGVSALLFNQVLGFPGADPAVPLYAFVFLVALGVDYNIFLMTRVREEAIKYGTREGILRGLIVTGGIITSAGIVLAATFAALGVIPVLFLVQLAFIVAFGVLLDALVVRSFLVPALFYDLGRVIWWPSQLAKTEPKHTGTRK